MTIEEQVIEYEARLIEINNLLLNENDPEIIANLESEKLAIEQFLLNAPSLIRRRDLKIRLKPFIQNNSHIKAAYPEHVGHWGDKAKYINEIEDLDLLEAEIVKLEAVNSQMQVEVQAKANTRQSAKDKIMLRCTLSEDEYIEIFG